MKLAANLTWMFQEISENLVTRYELAAAAGFKNVECPNPYQVDKVELRRKLQHLGLTQVLINSPAGDSRGFACHPGKKEEFRQSIQMTIDYARELKCDRIHVLAGMIPAEFKFDDCEEAYVGNLTYAAEQCEQVGITALIEPINPISIPNYFLFSYDKALNYINRIQQSNLKLMLIRRLLPFTSSNAQILSFLSPMDSLSSGHIQVAQVPHRHEPNSTGEIDYQYVFNLLNSVGYDEFIGLEYVPAVMEESSRRRCQFIVKRKGRQCRMLVRPGKEFCGEHGVFEVDQREKRIFCPLDSTHSCYEAELSEHLKRCNASKVMKEVWYDLGINSSIGQPVSFSENNSKVLKNAKLEVLQDLVKRIEVGYDLIKDQIILDTTRSHPSMAEVISSPEYGKTRKHLLQVSSLLAHLDDLSLLEANSCFMEFGAGRGKLTYWVAKAAKSLENCGFTMFERTGSRYKFENKFEAEEQLRRCRIKSDIENVNLKKIPFLREFDKRVFLWKHLCGSGTDAAIRGVFNSMKGPDSLTFEGYVMAPCCHHLSTWDQYVGKEFLQEMIGLGATDFPILAAITSWGTCGFEWSKDNIPAPTDRLDVNSSQKEEIGRKAKRLIDWGRSRFLSQMGFTAKMKFYTEIDVTPENLLICGVSQGNI